MSRTSTPMVQANVDSTTSRRRFLSILGLGGAATVTTVAVAAPAPKAEEPKGCFEHPAEYVAAMRAIGWMPAAAFIPLEDGGYIKMGVHETADKATIERTWRQFHAISMRAPVQLPFDVHPNQNWWAWVWQYLYDAGFRVDVTPTDT